MTLTMQSQRDRALEQANFIRSERAAWKRRIFDGQGDVRAAILEPPRYLETASLREVLMAVNRVGAVKALTLCRRAEVSPHRELGGLTTGERRRILAAMEGLKVFRR